MIKYKFVFKWFLISSILAVSVSYKSLYFFHIMLVILLFSNLAIHITKPLKTRNIILTNKHYFLYFFLAWYSLSIIWSINSQYTLIYLFYLFCGVVIANSIVYYSSSLERLDVVYRLCAAVFTLEILFSVLEVFTPFRLPISPYSKYVGIFGRETLSSDLLYVFRNIPTGFRWNSNNLATAMNLILPFFLLHNNKKVRNFGVLSILTIIIASSSRANFIAFFIILLFYGVLSKWPKKIMFLYLAPIALILFSLFQTQIISLIPAFSEVSTSFVALKVFLFSRSDSLDSIGARQQLINNGIEALKESYGIGVGGGGSVAVQELYGKVGGVYTSMHNFWVEVLVDGGVLFFVILIVWYTLIMYKLFKITLYSKDMKLKYYAKASLLSLIGFIPGAMSASSVIYFSPMWILFGFSISVINIFLKERKIQINHKTNV